MSEQRKVILSIEDNQDIANLIRLVLRHAPIELLNAPSGDEAWQLTATFCNALRARFRGGDPRGAGENPTIHYDPVCAAGNWEVDAAWPHISSPWRHCPAATRGLDTPVCRV